MVSGYYPANMTRIARSKAKTSGEPLGRLSRIWWDFLQAAQRVLPTAICWPWMAASWLT